MTRLMATCCPGLEGILGQEVSQTLGARMEEERGKVFFNAEPRAALQLRCADNIYAWVGQARTGPHRGDLPALAASAARLPLCEALAQTAPLGIEPGRIHLTASRSGKHSFSRFEAAEAVLPALCRLAGSAQGDEKNHTCALRMDIEGERVRLYIKLTPPTFRFRGVRDFSKAALRPTIAAALVRLTGPGAEDAFLDPFCGSGTLLSERLALPHRSIQGGDIDALAVEAARRNAPRARVSLWDAARLPLQEGSIDAVATNPPWGKQIALEDEETLYSGALRELGRVARPGASIVLLTDREEALRAACRVSGFSCERAAAISLHGMLAGIYRLGYA